MYINKRVASNWRFWAVMPAIFILVFIPLWLITIIGSALKFAGEKLLIIEYIPTPKWLSRLIDWQKEPIKNKTHN